MRSEPCIYHIDLGCRASIPGSKEFGAKLYVKVHYCTCENENDDLPIDMHFIAAVLFMYVII